MPAEKSDVSASLFNFPGLTINFVERPNLQEKIKHELNEYGKAIVTGLEGSGKTCLTVEVVRKILDEDKSYIAAIFINREAIRENDNEDDVQNAIINQLGSMEINLSSEDGKNQIIQLDKLQYNKYKKILYIFDGVTNTSSFVANLPDYVKRQNYIVTSRHLNRDTGLIGRLYFPNAVLIGAFEPNEAVTYLKKELESKFFIKCSEEIIAKLKRIAGLRYNYPLHLAELISDLLKKTGLIINTFDKKELEKTFIIKSMDVDIEEKFLLLDEKSSVEQVIDYESPYYQPKSLIEKAMVMPFINFRNNVANIKPQLHLLLSHLSLLYSQNIPRSLLETIIPDNEVLDQLIKYLEENCLISRAHLKGKAQDIPVMYNISPLFQFIWRNNLTKEQQNNYTSQAIIAMSRLMDDAVNAKQKTAIHHAYALHNEVLAHHGNRTKIRELDLAVINSKLGKYHSSSWSLIKAIEFYDSAITHYELWLSSIGIDVNSLEIAALNDNHKHDLIDYARCIYESCAIKINTWNEIDKEKFIFMLNRAKNILLELSFGNDHKPLFEIKALLATAQKSCGDYAEALNLYTEISGDNFHIIDAQIVTMLKDTISSDKIRLLQIYSDTLIKLHKISDKATRVDQCNELFSKFEEINNGNITEDSILNFKNYCSKSKITNKKFSKVLIDTDMLAHYEKLAHYRLTILKLYLAQENLTDQDHVHMINLCRLAAKACKAYFSCLKLEDASVNVQSPHINLDTAKIFYQVAQISLKIYNQRKDHLSDKIGDQDEQDEELNHITVKDKFCKGFLTIAFQMCNLGIVTHRTLNLSPIHPYSEEMKKLQDDIFIQVGVEDISDKLNWSAENHKIDGKMAKLFDKTYKRYKKCDKTSEECQALRFALGNMAIVLGRYKNAIKYFCENVEHDLKKGILNIEALKKLGCSYYCAKQYDKAVVVFRQVLEHYPTDFNIIKWLTDAKDKNENSKNQKLREVNDGTALSQFVNGFKAEFVRIVKLNKDRLTGKNKIEQDKALQVFKGLAAYLPTINLGPPGLPVGVNFNLADGTQKTLEEIIKISKAEHETQQFYVANFSDELGKSYSDELLNDEQRLMNEVHNIACTIADSFPNIINCYAEECMLKAGGGIAQRIIYHFANNLNDRNLPLNDQIFLAVFKGKCEKTIDLTKPHSIRPYSLDNIIKRSGLITPTGQVYQRSRSKITLSHSFPFFNGWRDKASLRRNDQRYNYNYCIGPLLHQMVGDYVPVKEEKIFEKTRLGSAIDKIHLPHLPKPSCGS